MLGDTADAHRLSAVEWRGDSIVDLLPDAHQVGVDRPLEVEGTFVLEVFAGECALTLAFLMHSVPCMRPWDSMVGQQFDVLLQGHVLIQLAQAGVLDYAALATPCQSQSWGEIAVCQVLAAPVGYARA